MSDRKSPAGAAVLEAVQAAYGVGLCVLPAAEDGSKRPDVPTWQPFLHARPTAAQMRAYSFARRSGYGVIAGAVSGWRESWDFDCAETYAAFVAAAGACGLGEVVQRIRAGYEDQTPNDGRRWIVTYPKTVEWRDCTLARRPGRDGEPKIKTLIELPTFAVLAPSNGAVHPSGRPYVRLSGGFDTIASYDADEREALLELARSFDGMPRREATPAPSATRGVGDRPGDRFNQSATWPAILEPAGWTFVYSRGETHYWRRPRKARGISASTNFGGADLFYPFTTSSEFKPEQSYSKFAAYAVLNCAGDFSAAARDLAAKGYGRKLGGADCGERTNASSWPKPLGEPAYHGLLGEIVRTIEPHTEADPAALLVQLVAAFGNAVGRGPHFVAEADRHRANLFANLVGPTSKGRKGSAWGYTARLFELARHTLVNSEPLTINVQSGLSSGEGLIWAVRDPNGDDSGVSDKRLIVLETEFASTLRVMSRDGNTLSAVIRNAWDIGDLQTLTKNSPAKATGAHISIIGHVTRDEVVRELNRTEAGNGFANRFLWTCARRSKMLPEGGQIRDEDLLPLAKRLAEAVDFAQTVGEMKRDEAARALWCKVYPELSAGKAGLLGAVIARAEAQVMRIALIYALVDCSPLIRKEHLAAALEVWRHSEDSARFIFGDAFGDPFADEIYRALRTAPTGLSRSDIRDLFGRNHKVDAIERALRTLAEHGLAYAESEATGGRPTERWHATEVTTETT